MPADSSLNSKKRQWDENYEKVLDFAKKHKHLNLSRKHAETRRLANWLKRQKTRKAVSDDEREKLDILNEYMDDRPRAIQHKETWNKLFEKLMEYKNVHGNFMV